MMLRSLALIAALGIALGACASSGNDVLRQQDANAVNQTIIDGRTTRADVERIYGPPTTTSFADAQNEIWTYRWGRATARAENFIPYVGAFVGGADVQKKELVILFNAQNVVVRHSMREMNDAVRRNLSAQASTTGNTPQISTSPAPVAAATEAAASVAAPAPTTQPAAKPTAQPAAKPSRQVAAAPTGPAPTLASIEPGRWTCGMVNNNDRRYAMSFVVAADRSITVANYANAPATVVSTSPLTFTAINPRGDRLSTFTLRPDNSLVVTGPGLNNPSSTFFDQGTCVRSGNA
jgi:hypothetical protein